MDEMNRRVTLSDRRQGTAAAFQAAGSALNTVHDRLETLVGENRRGKIIAAMVLNVVWAVAAIALYFLAVHYCGGWLGLPMLISTLVLTALMLTGQSLRLTHYKTMLDDLDRTAQMRRELDQNASVANARYGDFLQADSAGWDVPLRVSPSVPGEVDQISRRLQGMQAFDDGKMQRLLTAVFFVTTVLWTLFAAGSLHNQTVQAMYAATDFIGVRVSAHTAEVIFYVLFGIASVAAVIVSVAVWASTHMRVNNATLLSFLTGPVAFVILMVITRISLILLIIAIIIGVILLIRAILS